MEPSAELKPIQTDADYRRVQAMLSQQKRPPRVLRFLMNLFESYRQARKIGWSRPWNKYGVNTFQSFRLDPRRDEDLVNAGREVAAHLTASLGPGEEEFVRELLAGSEDLMGFMFLSEIEDQEGRFEAVTLSFGRVAPASPRSRDRFDVICESAIHDGVGGGLARVRVFVDPFRGRDRTASAITLQDEFGPARALFDRLCLRAFEWAEVPERQWVHWTSAYIDYFGPRRWSVTRPRLPDVRGAGTSVASHA